MYFISYKLNQDGEKLKFEIACDEESVVNPQLLHVAARDPDQNTRFSIISYESLNSSLFLLGKITVKRNKENILRKLSVSFDNIRAAHKVRDRFSKS